MGDVLTLEEITSLLKVLSQYEVTEFKLDRPEEKLWLKRGSGFHAERTVVPGPIPLAPAAYAPAALGQTASLTNGQAASSVTVVDDREAASEVPVSPARQAREVKSPMVGTFYRRPAVDAEPYVEVGDYVKKGDVLCIVEAMKVMNEIESDLSGRIVEICLEDAQMVEYGEVLFRIDPLA